MSVWRNNCILKVDDHESRRKYNEIEEIDGIVFGYSTVFYITGIVPKTLARMKKTRHRDRALQNTIFALLSFIIWELSD